MENIQENEVVEIDTVGGWVVTHHSKTWDTRVPLREMDNKLNEAIKERDAAQAKVDALQAQTQSFKVEIQNAVLAKAIDAVAVSTPAKI